MEALIQVLEQQCRCLAHLRYRASVAALLLRGGETRFLPRVADEIHDAVDRLSAVDLLRATVVAGLTGSDGDDAPCLAEIIATAPPAAASRLRDLQDRLRSELTELQTLTGSATAVAASELETIRRSLGRWSGVSPTTTGYGPGPALGPARFDRPL